MAKQKTGGGGPSQRQLMVGETIRRRLSEALLRGDAHDPELARRSITVSEVRASPDLRHATAFVMPLGGKDAEAALTLLRRNAGALRRLVARDLRTKYTPELRFQLDESFDRMDETRRLLSDAHVRQDTGVSQDAGVSHAVDAGDGEDDGEDDGDRNQDADARKDRAAPDGEGSTG